MPEITVGEFLDQLKVYPLDATLSFTHLEFNRLKMRGENLVNVEFVQQILKDENGQLTIEEVE